MKKATSFFFYALYALIIIFSLEGLVRMLRLAPDLPKGGNIYTSDEYLPYKMKPLVANYIEPFGREYAFLCRHNSAGLRDTEHDFRKPENVFRILALGDSFTYGIGAAFEDTYLFKLESMLNKQGGRNPEFEIIKAGIPGFFPETERIFLEHYGVRYQPDLIIIAFLPNDVIDTYFGVGALKVNSGGFLSMYEKTHFLSLIHCYTGIHIYAASYL